MARLGGAIGVVDERAFVKDWLVRSTTRGGWEVGMA